MKRFFVNLKIILSTKAKQYTSIGGQAVIEGVMMRSPNTFVIAVRKADGSIRLRRDQWYGMFKKFKFLKKPLIRGVFVLLETMANGIVALNYSARIALADEMKKEAEKKGLTEEEFEKKQKKKEKVGITTWISIGISIIFGIALFKAVPHFLTVFFSSAIGVEWGLENYRFHVVDGTLKALIFLLYVFIIGFIPDIRRVFQYHGAEHKAISTFEAGQELTVENARKFTTFHPRCGTTFIFFLLFISIILFAVIFGFFPIGVGLPNGIKHVVAVGVKILLMFPIAGISFELIKLMGKKCDTAWGKSIAYPGMLLQRLTTREPDDEQLEVGIASIKTALFLEDKFNLKELAEKKTISMDEIDITKLDEIKSSIFGPVDFLE